MIDPYEWRVRVVPDPVDGGDWLYLRLGGAHVRVHTEAGRRPWLELVQIEPGAEPPPELGIPLGEGAWQAIVAYAQPQGELVGRLDERGRALERAERRVDDMLARALAPGVVSPTRPGQPERVWYERPDIAPHPFVPLEMQRDARPGRCWLFIGPGMICDHLRDDPVHRGGDD